MTTPKRTPKRTLAEVVAEWAALPAKDRGALLAFIGRRARGNEAVAAQYPDADVRTPAPTVTGQGGHLAEVRAFLVKYYGAGEPTQDLFGPLHTVTAKARFGLVMVHGEPYELVDIGMRMLQPHELFGAQGFRADYDITCEHNGKPLTKTAQIRLAGNSVCPPVAEAIVRANVTGAQEAA